MSNVREYRSWWAMMERCYNPAKDNYHAYGGRGITVDAAWFDFHTFLKDMGSRPSGKTLGRINNDGNYGPNNCRWETLQEQMRNTRINHWITYHGLTLCITDWPAQLNNGVTEACIRSRLEAGWPIGQAMETPPRSRQMPYHHPRRQVLSSVSFPDPLSRPNCVGSRLLALECGHTKKDWACFKIPKFVYCRQCPTL